MSPPTPLQSSIGSADVYDRIIEDSRIVDEWYVQHVTASLTARPLTYQVPAHHPRHRIISSYDCSYSVSVHGLVNELMRDRKATILLCADSVMRSEGMRDVAARVRFAFTEAVISKEATTKTREFAEECLSRVRRSTAQVSRVVVVGGGLVLNLGAYIAEHLRSELVLVPTTLLSVADGSGGKVRLNAVFDGRAYKHIYKSFYEPNVIVVCEELLRTLPKLEIANGLGEIAKHALFQSPALYEYLMAHSAGMYADLSSAMRAAWWTADLKRACLEYDVDENEYGSRSILRAGHDISDRLEEDSNLRLPHGAAVVMGIIADLRRSVDERQYRRAMELFVALGIPAVASLARNSSRSEGIGRWGDVESRTMNGRATPAVP